MKIKEKISFVVPFYNSASTISSCIKSIQSQTGTDGIEIILVNDGSTDTSLQICEKFYHKDPRIKIVTQEHRGVSAARNNGINHATGNWITFIDADDTIKSNFYETLATSISDNVDLLVGCTTSIINNKPIDILSSQKERRIILRSPGDKKDFCASIFYNYTPLIRYPHTACCHAKLFRKNIIDSSNLKFNEQLVVYEDAYFIMDFIAHSNAILFNNKPIYNYNINNTTSAVHRYSPKDTLRNYKKAYEVIMRDKEISNLFNYKDIDYLKNKDLNQILKNCITAKIPFKEFKKILTSDLFEKSLDLVDIKKIPKLNRTMTILSRIKAYKTIYVIYYLNNLIRNIK